MNHTCIEKKLYLFFIIFLQGNILQSSQYAPNIQFHKPYSTEPYLSSSSSTFSATHTSQAFNENSELVPYLQQFGNEDFLEKFINPSLDRDDTTSLGRGSLSGEYHFKQLFLGSYKNIHRNMFIGFSAIIQDLSIDNITGDFVESEYPLTETQIDYLDKFRPLLPNKINQSGLFTATVFFGYNKKFTNFKSIDFLQLFLKTGMGTPQKMHNDNNSILQFAPSENITFAYPTGIILAVGILNKITFGFHGIILPFQESQQSFFVNRTEARNKMLLTQNTQVKINHDPLIGMTGYIEINNEKYNLTGTIGYNHTQGLDWKLTAIQQDNYPSKNINSPATLQNWSISSLFFQVDKTFKQEKLKHFPTCSLLLVIPLSGVRFPHTYVFGGSCGFQLNYDF